MISEELVASGGTQVHEANISERPPKATATQEPRVSGSMGPPGSQGLPWPFPPREALGKRGVLAVCPGDGLLCSSWFPLTLVPLASRTHGRVQSSL